MNKNKSAENNNSLLRKNGLKRFTGNPLTILIVAVIYAVSAIMVYTGLAGRQFTSMLISIS